MKKIMKSFMAMALGLSLVLSGCSKDDEENSGSSFEGNYTTQVTVRGVPVIGTLSFSPTLTLSKSGENYTASAELSQQIPGGQLITGSLSLDLTSVTETANAGGIVTYSFKVTEQKLTIASMGEIPVSGEGTLSSITIAGVTQCNIMMTLTAQGGISIEIDGVK